jgi:hypothetical protein
LSKIKLFLEIKYTQLILNKCHQSTYSTIIVLPIIVKHVYLDNHSHVKYVAWINENHKYKQNRLSKLSTLQIDNLIIGFSLNKSLTEYIFKNRFDKLFDFSFDFINKYTYGELLKLYKLTEFIDFEDLIKIYSKPNINISNITKHNAKLILMYINNESNFINRKIEIDWGPGNHGNKEKNIEEHYNKHLLSSEIIHWSNILQTISIDYYKQYAINSFYKMKKVMIHSNGKNVHLSGFYGNVFIIGRYNKGIFGLSSCYYVHDGEKGGREKDLCFTIDLTTI